jgi:hypothetical protein
VYFKSGKVSIPRSSPPEDYATYFVGADGTGRWFLSWTGFPLSLAGGPGNIPDIGIRLQAGFVFLSSLGDVGHGNIDTSRPNNYTQSCNAGIDRWISLNWPKIFASNVYFGYQQAAGFSDLPPASNIWTNAGFGQTQFIQLSGTNVPCSGQGSGSPLFPYPRISPDLYVATMTASARAQALKIGSKVVMNTDTIRQIITSPHFNSSAARSIAAYIATPAAVATISDAAIIATEVVRILSPGMSPPSPGQGDGLSLQLTGSKILAAASGASSALKSSTPMSEVVTGLKDALQSVTEAVDKALDAAAEALSQAIVNSGGNYEEIPLEVFVDLTIWAAESLSVNGPDVAASPVSGPDPADAGVSGGTPDDPSGGGETP